MEKLTIGYFSGRGRGKTKERVQYCLNPKGHSGGNLADLALQDSVLFPEDFTEYHIGNASERHSIIRSGLIPGERRLKRDKQSVFFTAVNPVDDDQSMEEIRCDLDKPRIAP